MDYKRLFLLFSLGLIALWLWQAWEKDYPSQTPQTQQTITSNKTAKQSSADVPQFATETKNNTGNTVSANQINSNAVSSADIVTVTTDTLDIKIDTKGGNIIYAALRQYPKSENTPNDPVVLLNNNTNSLYIAQSGLLSKNGPDTSKGQAQYQVAKHSYKLEDGQKNVTVDLSWKNSDGITIVKQFVFTRGEYSVNVNYKIDNKSTQPWNGRSYNQIKRKEVSEKKSLFQIGTYTGAAMSTPDEHYEKVSFSDMQDNNISVNAKGGWVAMLQHYFLSAWVPNQNQNNHFYSKAAADGSYIIGEIGPSINVLPGSQTTISNIFYVGPGQADTLKAIAPYLDLTVDYGWLWFISIIIFWLMKQIHYIVGNWGWSIVFVTILIKALFYKLSATSYRSMASMRRLQPKMQQLKERHKDDKSKFSQAMMELYRKEKVNPLSGCLPILVQIPVFIALYWVLIESVELRQAPFIFWIHDLSIKDPFYILPLLMGLSMFIQQKLNPTPPDPMQAKVMMMLPFVFTIFFLNFPAGLVLYWTVNNSISILQQWYVMRKVETEHQQNKANKQAAKKLPKKKD